MTRNVLICDEIIQRNHPFIEVLHSCICTGFNSAPLLQYSDKEKESVGFIDKSRNAQIILNWLVSPEILKSFICTPVAQISCGFEHCLALTVFGTVASWGYGASGCLGHGNTISYTSPKLIQTGGIQEYFITRIESGGYHNAATTANGKLFMWGRSDVGQIGLIKSWLEADDIGFVSTVPQHVNYF